MKTTKDSVQAVHALIEQAKIARRTPIEAMQLTQAALNAANAIAAITRLPPDPTPPQRRGPTTVA